MMKSIVIFSFLFFNVSIAEEPAGWTFVDIYMLTRGLTEQDSIRYKMEASFIYLTNFLTRQR